MTHQEEVTVETLNELYAACRRSPLPRLAESNVFLSNASAAESELVLRMLAEQREHEARLIAEINRCGGGLYPASPDPTSGNLHFLSLHAILPQAIAGLEQLVRAHAEAQARGGALTPAALGIISGFTGRLRQHLMELSELHARVAEQTSYPA